MPFQDCAEESEPSDQSPASSREAAARCSQSSLPLWLKVCLLLKQHNVALQSLPSYFTGRVPEHFRVPIFQLVYMYFPILRIKISEKVNDNQKHKAENNPDKWKLLPDDDQG